MSETDTARVELLAVADDLRLALDRLNRYGDYVNPLIVAQCDGCAYGEVHDGLRVLLEALFDADTAVEVLNLVFEADMAPSAAAAHVLHDH